ncbi:MAG: IS200/IS605 family accessory protein TnpB-related protein [Calothrix sp. MO_192.B10]|nr:IS200/IS605 family accessory protein TnpB-related protein [Calothrix sp. MO_192.B10]
MSILTYTKGLPTPADEMNAVGFTEFEMFLYAFTPIYRSAVCETVNHLITLEKGVKFNKGGWNTHLQKTYGLNKRQANGVISDAKGQFDAAKEHRKLHIKTLEGKLKSAREWVRKAEKKLKNARKFYHKKNWHNSKTGCCFPISCSLKFRDTNWQNLRFQLHNKKRIIADLERRIEKLKNLATRVKVPHNQVFIVGSKGETLGNQSCQWDGEYIKFRVPYCLENRFGKFVTTRLGGFDRNINRLPACDNQSAKSWQFYYKNGKWNAAVQFTPTTVKTEEYQFTDGGVVAYDLNVASVDWAYIDSQGNLKHHGKIPFELGLRTGKQDAQIVEVALQLATLAKTFSCPVVGEHLDFFKKKEQLKEQGKKYARMLSGWAYARFNQLLASILTNRGIKLIHVNPAYTSQIGLIKYLRMYGISSGVAAAIAIGRRAMYLSERLPLALTALDGVNPSKHVWSGWRTATNSLKSCTVLNRRHDYYSIPNWGLVVKSCNEAV